MAERVLIVDDNLTNLQVLYQALEAEGFDLLVAQSGAEALTIAKNAHPAIVLLDINMPGMDGYETCRRLKADPELAKSVVLFLSARRSLDDKLEGFNCGAVDFIEKPFQFEEVVARVRTHLATWHRERELEEAARNGDAPSFRDFSENEINKIATAGESEKVEFKSTLRQNLHTGKPDKRIENACLKTIAAYLNSEGGLLLVGINDDGKIIGLMPDNFPNGDKLLLHITSLVRSHLGGEVAPFVRYSSHELNGVSVLAVDCLPSPDPVYFRRDNDEYFYVRSGPATQALSPSEIVSYVVNRGKA